MLRQITASGLRFQIYDAGKGPPIFFIHGFPLSHRMWDQQLTSLADKFRVIAPDLRGFGGSGVTSGTVTIEQMADDCASILMTLELHEAVDVVGLSMGGYVAMQLAYRHPALLKHLVLCNTKAAPDSADAAANRLKMADHVLRAGNEIVATAMLPRLFASHVASQYPEVVAAVRQMILTTAPEGLAAAQRGMAIRPDARPGLPTITARTLVVCGSEDVISPPDEMQTIADAIPGARYLEFAGQGHMTPMEAPGPFNAALVDFLTAP